MPTITNVTNLKINELTEAQYDTAVQGGVIGANELSIITDMEDKAVQVSTMPTASATELGNIYQFVGTTDANYTNGYFYKCVSDGQTPATYSWTQTDVQPNAGGLPDQTGQSGKFLTTDGTSASWGNALVNNALFNNPNSNNLVVGKNASISGIPTQCVVLGTSAYVNGDLSVVIGESATVGVKYGTNYTAAIAIGRRAVCRANNCILLNVSGVWATNSDANTVKIANANGMFEIMSADGTIPADRFTTTPSADGTYVPTLTISSGVASRSWAAPAGGASSATATLAVADWSSNTQTVNVTGVTANNNVIVAAAPASQADYTSAGIICTAQGAGTLTFTCVSVPSSAITVNVLII